MLKVQNLLGKSTGAVSQHAVVRSKCFSEDVAAMMNRNIDTIIRIPMSRMCAASCPSSLKHMRWTRGMRMFVACWAVLHLFLLRRHAAHVLKDCAPDHVSESWCQADDVALRNDGVLEPASNVERPTLLSRVSERCRHSSLPRAIAPALCHDSAVEPTCVGSHLFE